VDDDAAPVSATGGSARTQAVDADARRWRTRRLTSVALRTAAVLLPFGASFVAGRLCASSLPHPHHLLGAVGWWAAVITVSSLALLGVDRLARRLLPIAMLYRLALVFPDKAPSRYRVALRTGTAHQLRERLANGGDLGDTPAEAAENLLALVAALGRHDRITRGHSERVRAYADVIAGGMGLSDPDRQRLHWAALVHDVGKMTVRPEVLNKAGRPTDEEWQELRNHPAAAAALVEPLRPWLGEWVDAATQHHERIDGKGYPHGLAGTDISLAGRIVAVADAYDCMTSARSYKKALPAEQARYELTRNSGTQFDPEVVRALLGVSVGRLHLAGGPLSWLAQLPGAREAFTLTGSTGASVSAGVAAATITVAGAVGGFFAPPSDAAPVSAARESAAVEVVDEGAPAPVAGERPRADAGSPGGADDEPVAVDEEPGDEPGAPVTAPPSADGHASPTTTMRPPSGGSPGGPVTTTTRAERPAASPTTAPPVHGGGTTTTHAPSPSVTTTAAPPPPPQVPTTTTSSPPPNLAPLANADSYEVGTWSTTDFDVLANDTDLDGSLDQSSVRIVIKSSLGSATVLPDGRIRFTATALLGSGNFRYEVCDDDGDCSQAVVHVRVKLLGLI
jgi:HD-GYP domain-containing protein (c-di-GMP phosphodiesterase class II)